MCKLVNCEAGTGGGDAPLPGALTTQYMSLVEVKENGHHPSVWTPF
jgi:hypothetical protein